MHNRWYNLAVRNAPQVLFLGRKLRSFLIIFKKISNSCHKNEESKRFKYEGGNKRQNIINLFKSKEYIEMEKLSRNIGMIIKQARKDARMNLAMVAMEIDKSPATLSRYENGEILPDIETLYALSKCLSVNILKQISFACFEKVEAPIVNDQPLLYMLYYDGKMRKEMLSVIKTFTTSAGTASRMLCYHDVKSINEPNSCKNLYEGQLLGSNAGTYLSFISTKRLDDRMFIILETTDPKITNAVGLLAASNKESGFAPMATKCLVTDSIDELPVDNENLLIDPLELKNIKRTNMLVVKESSST